MTDQAEQWFDPHNVMNYLDDRPWLVRAKDTKFAVGIFCCPVEMLTELVDQFIGPADCEVAKVAYGGIYFENNFPVHDGGSANVLSDDQFEEQCCQEDRVAMTDSLAEDISYNPLQWVDLETVIEAWADTP